MSAITDWPGAFADRRFWATRYGLDETHVALFDVSIDEWNAYYYHLMGCENNPEELDELDPVVEGNVFTLSFPEHFTWQMEFTPEGIFHTIFHPQFYPDGTFIAEESGSPRLPGLRWAELKQMVVCLQQSWKEPFDVRTIIPLLYPVVGWTTFDELNDARQTLYVAWEMLHVLEHPNIDKLLDKTLGIYDGGHFLWYDPSQGWYNPSKFPLSVGDKQLWYYDPASGWYTHAQNSRRRNPEHFTPFFAMLEHCIDIKEIMTPNGED